MDICYRYDTIIYDSVIYYCIIFFIYSVPSLNSTDVNVYVKMINMPVDPMFFKVNNFYCQCC